MSHLNRNVTASKLVASMHVLLVSMASGAFMLGIGAATSGCNLLTPQTEADLEKASAAVLCAIERAEFDDPGLNSICDTILGQLTPAQRSAVMAHAEKARTARLARPVPAPVACPPVRDAGQ